MSPWLKDIIHNPYYIAKTGLGKFIILGGCLLHMGWATMLMFDDKAAGATPLSAIYFVCQRNAVLTIFLLLLVSVLSLRFLTLKAHAAIRPAYYAALMLPQLTLLALSLCAGIHATWVGYYMDTVAQPGLYTIVHRPRLFILSDQFPIMVLAILYLTAVMFACAYRIPNNANTNSRH